MEVVSVKVGLIEVTRSSYGAKEVLCKDVYKYNAPVEL